MGTSNDARDKVGPVAESLKNRQILYCQQSEVFSRFSPLHFSSGKGTGIGVLELALEATKMQLSISKQAFVRKCAFDTLHHMTRSISCFSSSLNLMIT